VFNNLVKNKYVLYLVALLAFVCLLGFIMNKQFSAVLFFYLSGLITYYYTKNMTIVLGTAVLATSVVHLCKNVFNIREGLDNNDEDDTTEEADADAGADADADAAIVPPPVDDVDNDEDDEDDNTAAPIPRVPVTNKKAKKADAYQNLKLQPGLYNMPNKKQLQKQLGKASKLESAYDNLDKVIGNNNIKSMSSDTENLIKQQNELLKQLKEITPVLNQAMTSVSKIDMGKITDMFGGLTGMMSKTQQE
tara:strand:- start:1664 stop:2410 length:747 start_codon:yes stop_codon:yes gene_type:complete